MHINFHGRLVDERELRIATIGCGSHSFRNIYPVFQFTHVKLVATCDLDPGKARAFAEKFGAEKSYSDHREMLAKEDLDAVFIVVGYDKQGRPMYPSIACDCMAAGCHTWIEKPPAASTADIEKMQEAALKHGRKMVVGLKKMFMPANKKARELMDRDDFTVSMVMTQYPQHVPTIEEFDKYKSGENLASVVSFLDHLCHPMSLLVYLMGMPETLFYQRAFNGSGLATFTYASGAVSSLALTIGSSINGGMERTMISSNNGQHIVVENNVRLAFHRSPPPEAGTGYGSSPNFYTGSPEQTIAYWEPEFSLGQLYNKGLFLIGYYDEINEFVESILQDRQPERGTLEQAWQVTRVFEAFAEGPGKVIQLK